MWLGRNGRVREGSRLPLRPASSMFAYNGDYFKPVFLQCVSILKLPRLVDFEPTGAFFHGEFALTAFHLADSVFTVTSPAYAPQLISSPNTGGVVRTASMARSRLRVDQETGTLTSRMAAPVAAWKGVRRKLPGPRVPPRQGR
jgi:hypothetical protein